ISTKSEPEIVKNGTPASPATARASSVLPVPGGPYSSTPFGILAPIAWNLAGLARNSLISWSSSTASSAPATSANVVFGVSLLTSLALERPKLITRLPPPCIWLITKKSTPTISRIGSRLTSRESQGLSLVTLVVASIVLSVLTNFAVSAWTFWKTKLTASDGYSAL